MTGRDPGAVRRTDGWVLAALLASVAPLLIASARALASGWIPTGDDAFYGLRGLDVFSRNPPLLGTWSSASVWSGVDVHHPGPAIYDAMAVPSVLFGPFKGVIIGTMIVNLLAIIGMAWCAYRIGGRPIMLVTLLGITTLQWSMGSEVLFDPWNPHLATLPFALVLVSTAATVTGEVRALPIAVVASSVVLQAHLSFVLLVPALMALATGAVLVDLVRSRSRPDGAGRRRGAWRWVAISLVLVGICWARPAYEQISRPEGNVTLLRQVNRLEPPSQPGLGKAADATATAVALPPLWLPPSWSELPVGVGRTPPSSRVSRLALGTVGLVLGALLVSAVRRRDRLTVALLSTAAVSLVVAVLTASRSTSPYGLVPTYLRYLWPISMFVWTSIAVATSRTLPMMRWWADQRSRLGGVPSAVGLATLIVVAAVALPYRDNGSGSPPWGREPTRDVIRAARPALEGADGVVIDIGPWTHNAVVVPPLIAILVDEGMAVTTPDLTLAHQIGLHRLSDPTRDARLPRLVFTGGDAPPPGDLPSGARATLLHRHEGLSPAEATEHAELNAMFGRQLESDGGIGLTDLARRLSAAGELDTDAQAIIDLAETDPYGVGSTPYFEYYQSLFDPGPFGADRLRRLLELVEQGRHRSGAMYLVTTP